MPHLEFQTYAGQLFWLALCFIVLYAALSTFVLPKISGVIEARGNTIAHNLTEAEAAKIQAERLSAQHEKLAIDSGEKARKMIEESSQKAKAAVEQKRAALSLKLDDKLAKAEKEIAKIEKEAMLAVDEVSGELTDLIISKFNSKAA